MGCDEAENELTKNDQYLVFAAQGPPRLNP